MKYRPEIDGLRSLAVLPVVLYHAGLPWLPGGFMGVDVFFVISGYLITKIIWGELQTGRFSIAGFYERRFRRIVPALLAVLVAVLGLSLLYALPQQVEDTYKSALAALFSVSNFYFWTQSGYFAPAVEFMPLLHTWSLAVEEQFYVIFPLLLLAAFRLKLDARKWVLWSLPILYGAALYLSYAKPSVAFYLLPARAWELGLGAALGLGAIPQVRHPPAAALLAGVGVLLLLGGYLFGNSGMLFPGYIALLPSLGTALVIHCAHPGTGVTRALSWRPLVLIGLISYSLYLWHWPALVFMRMATADATLEMVPATIAVLASLVAAYLSWRFVEKPFRHRGLAVKPALAYAGIASLLVVAVATLGIWGSGFPGRLSEASARAIAVKNDVDPLREACSGVRPESSERRCTFGAEGPTRWLLVGDSHAAALRPSLERLPAFHGMTGELWWQGVCALLDGVRRYPRQVALCEEFRKTAFEEILKRGDVKVVVLAARWSTYVLGTEPEQVGLDRSYLVANEGALEPTAEATVRLFEDSLTRTVDRISASGKQVVIIGGVPEPGFDVPLLIALALHNGVARSGRVTRAEVAERNRLVDSILGRLAQSRDGVYFVPLWDAFCESTECVTGFDGVPSYSDDDHVSYSFARGKLADIVAARWPVEAP